jgi:hypothetical protein
MFHSRIILLAAMVAQTVRSTLKFRDIITQSGADSIFFHLLGAHLVFILKIRRVHFLLLVANIFAVLLDSRGHPGKKCSGWSMGETVVQSV